MTIHYNIIGIKRDERFSPNSVERDERIFNAVTDILLSHGHIVTTMSEKDFVEKFDDKCDRIFSMARSEECIEKLERIKKEGTIIVNSPLGLRQSKRITLTNMLIEANVPYPKSIVTRTCKIEDYIDSLNFPCWIKRGDACAENEKDVSFVKSKEDLSAIITDFKQRGINEIVVSEHLEGDIVKFYGIEGSNFFFWLYPNEKNAFSKFGKEVINGDAKHFSFDEAKLIAACDKASKTLSIKVYGGDCIIDKCGNFKIIDFNDWPSFSPCCSEAAKAIAKVITD